MLNSSVTCDDAAEALTRQLGFDCNDVSPVVSVRNPLDLAHWTMPLLELLIIAGAIWALVHAIRRCRQGDSISVALWIAPLVYLMVTEPPLYFPEWFGLDEIYGFIFAHNQFTVQFMWDRLPLYIIAIYPAMFALSYETVRVLGIFKNRGALQGSIAVAFVAQIFYEIFDQIGPQLGWWAWNDDNDIVNHPALASVPMTSMLLFASVSIGVCTYMVVRFIGTKEGEAPRRGWSLVWRIVVIGVLTPPTMAIAGIPASFFGGDTPNVTGQAWVLGIELGLVWLAGGLILLGAFRRRGTDEVVPMSSFAKFYPVTYVTFMAVFWVTALPAFFDATDGITADGTPIGSGWYAIACFIAADIILALLYTGRKARSEALTG